MAYLVLARKYRPQTFEQVVGQQHVTRTLANAIDAGRVAHAILFSGPRGTGKTTIARILAKAMNCEKGPAHHFCNQCRSCVEITSSSAVDVFEIDGASNNSVDQIRDLRENIKYMPAHSTFKIYIIDEVHMLSIAAFNALLKTLEEPPKHVMFIFATTEPHKIPITILSRCQRHDLKRIEIESIAKYMEMICEKEESPISGETLSLIARESGGSMRDGLSLLDQVLSCADSGLTHEQLLGMLGAIDRKIIFDISASVFQRDMPAILESIETVFSRGQDIKKLYVEIMEHFRHLMIVKMGKKVDVLVDLPAHEIKMMQEQVTDVSPAFISQVFDMLFAEEANIRLSALSKTALEMAFLKIDQINPALTIDMLIQRLDQFKNSIGADGPDQAASTAQDAAAISGIKEKAVPYPQNRSEAVKDVNTRRESQKPEAVEKEAGLTEDTGALWGRVVERVSEEKPSIAAILEKCRLIQVKEGLVEIEVSGNGYETAAIKKHQRLLEKVCLDYLGQKVDLNISENKTSGQKRQNKIDRENSEKKRALRHPLVADAVELFNGKVNDVKIIQEV